MAGKMKVRAKLKQGACEVKALLKHPMDSGFRKDKATGKTIPAHFIQELVCKLNGNEVVTSNWGGTVSKNPFVSFKLDAKKGDSVEISWVDNKGGSQTATTKVK